MATTTDPEYPVAGEEVTLATDLGDPDVARFELTAVPNTSALSLGLFVDEGGLPIKTFTPDVAGEYTVIASGYYDFTAPQAYVGDPCGGTRTKLMGVETTTINIGGYAELPIEPVNGHRATLRLAIVGDYVRAAELVDFGTELARVAALDTTVAAAVTALVGIAVSALDVDFIADVNACCLEYEAHRVDTISHDGTGDTVNVLLREPAYSVPAALRRLNDWSSKIIGHTESLTSGGTWHASDDTKNTLQVKPFAGNLGEGTILKADLRERVYERHRMMTSTPAPDVHSAADELNFLADPLPLPVAIVAYLDFIATNSAGAAAGEGEGLADAQAGFGFTVR